MKRMVLIGIFTVASMTGLFAKEWTTLNMNNQHNAVNDEDIFEIPDGGSPSFIITNCGIPVFTKDYIVGQGDVPLCLFSKYDGELLARYPEGSIGSVHIADSSNDNDYVFTGSGFALKGVNLQTGEVLYSQNPDHLSGSAPLILDSARRIIVGVGKCSEAFDFSLNHVAEHCENEHGADLSGTIIYSDESGVSGGGNDSDGFIQGISCCFGGPWYSKYDNFWPWGCPPNDNAAKCNCLNYIELGVLTYYQGILYTIARVHPAYMDAQGCEQSPPVIQLLKFNASSGGFYGATTIPGGQIYCIDEGSIFVSRPGYVDCYDTGFSLKWSKSVISPSNIVKIRKVKLSAKSQPVEAILLSMGMPSGPDGDGNVKTLYALNPSDGKVLWHSNDNGSAYVQSSGNSVYVTLGANVLKYGVDKTGYPANFSQKISGSGANSLSGNVIKSVTDAEIPGVGLSFKFVRTYNSMSIGRGVLGKGWNHNYEINLQQISAQTYILNRGDGKKIKYLNTDGSSVFKGPSWDNATLQANTDGTYTLTERNKLIYKFNRLNSNNRAEVMYIQDLNSNRMNFTYNSNNRLSQITDISGRQITFNYSFDSLQENLTSILLPDGKTINYTIDTFGWLTDVTGPGSNVNAHYNYDPSKGMLSNYVEPRLPAGDKSKSYYYDSTNRLYQVMDGNGTMIETYSYDDANLKTTKTDGNGNIYKDYYDDEGRIVRTDKPGGLNVQYTWDGFNKTSGTDEKGITTNYEYDQWGEVTKKTTAVNTAVQFSENYTYDGNGNVSSYTNGLVHMTSYSYFPGTNNLQSKTVEVDPSTTDIIQYTYFSNGLMSSITDGEQKTTYYNYDSYGNLLYIQDPAGKQEVYTYDPTGQLMGRILNKTDRDGTVTTYAYNDSGKVQTVTWSGQGHSSSNNYTYDTYQEQSSIVDGRGKTTYMHYDGNGILTSTIYPDGSGDYYTYDNNGNLKTKQDRDNKTTTYNYDNLNRQISIHRPGDAGLIQKDYWENGLLKTLTKPYGSETIHYDYDEARRMTSMQFPSPQKKVTKQYDAAGNVTTLIDGDTTINYTYDYANRATKIKYAGSKEFNYTYNYNGAVKTASKNWGLHPDEVLTYNYDSCGRLTWVQSSTTSEPSRSYNYSDGGKRVEYSMGSDYDIKYDYDYLGRISNITDKKDSNEVFSYNYDAAGNILKLTYPNGTHIDYTPDLSINRIKEMKYINNAVSGHDVLLDDVNYTYDNMNNVQGIINLTGNKTFTYDDDYRLTGLNSTNKDGDKTIDNLAYTYNDNGYRTTMTENSVQTSYTYNVDRLNSYGTTSCSYDFRGNMSGSTGALYMHDETNMLTQIDKPGKTIMYTYDIENRLKSRMDLNKNVMDIFHYDGRDIVMEKDASGNVNSYYIRGPGGEMLKEKRRYTNTSGSFTTKYYYYPDRIGSVYMICDDHGMILEKANDGTFGEKKSGTGISKFGLTSNMYDTDTGLYYFAARWYDPKIGRFLEMDPVLSEAGMMNMYEYCASNPANFTDRYGKNMLDDIMLYVVLDYEPPKTKPHEQYSEGEDPGITQSDQDAAKNRDDVASVIYGEAGGLQPGKSSSEELMKAYGVIAHTYINGKGKYSVNKAIPDTSNDIEFERWEECQIAAEYALNSEDPTNGAVHFNLRDTKKLNPQTSASERGWGDVDTSNGAFYNPVETDELSKGDVYINSYCGGK